jgi:uncharacterized protein
MAEAARTRLRTAGPAAIALAIAAIGAALAAPQFPTLSGRVVDEAGLLDPAAESRLTDKLAALETQTGNQLVVVTLRSLQDYDIADYGYQLGRHWGIGERGRNNGALLIVAPNERKVRIEVGYGLEGLLTDAVTRLIIDNAILPRFRTGDFAGGIERGADDIVQVLSGEADDYKRRAAERSGRPQGAEGGSAFVFVLIILFVWLILYFNASRRRPMAARRRGGWWGPPVIVGSPGGWSGGGWSSGGSSGGGFSGGGGSFGGGGSSGSW